MSRSSAPSQPRAAAPAGHHGPEKRHYPRFELSIPGRFMRADKRDYPCRLKDISVGGAAMTTPTTLRIGENVIVYLLHLGGLEGTIVRRFSGGFAMCFAATQRKREKLAAQIRRLSSLADIPEAEERRHPRNPSTETSLLLLADGTVLECPILDLSHSGASIVTPLRPPVGTEVIFANKHASVIRHHEDGIAIEFVNQSLERERAFQ